MAEAVSAVQGSIRRFLTFLVGGEPFAVDAGTVREIIRPPAIARVPRMPASLLGLANLRGTVLPVASLALLMGRESAAGQSTSRVIVLGDQAPVGVLVDHVSGLVDVADDMIRDGAFALNGTPVRNLDVGNLLAASYAGLSRPVPPDVRATDTARNRGAAAETDEDRSAFLSFDVGFQEYALPLQQVREIVAAPPDGMAAEFPGSAIQGSMTLRNRRVTLISLRGLLGFEAHGYDPHRAKIVVVAVGSSLVGLISDAARAILRVPVSAIDPFPDILGRRSLMGLQSVGRLEGGTRLVSILALERLFDADMLQAIAAHDAEDQDTRPEMQSRDISDEEQFVVFHLAGEEYGLPILSVQEVIRVPADLTPVPNTPAFVEGVVNLRGTAIPVVDQRRRFDLPPGEQSDRRRIVVVGMDRQRVGFIVDSVARVIKVSRDEIVDAPDITGDQVRLVPRVIKCRDETRIILLLDPQALLDSTERRLQQAKDEGPAA